MRRFSGDRPEKKNATGKSTVGKPGRPKSDKPWNKTGDSDKPWKKSSEGSDKSWVRKDRSFDKSSKDSRSDNERPWKKNETSSERPWKKREDSGDKPWKKNEASGDRPWKKSETSGDRPWKKSETSGDRPYRKSETSGDRPYRKSETSGDKPWKRNESSGDKPWKKDENSGDKPWRNTNTSGDKPWKKDETSGDKPWRKSDTSNDRPYRKSETSSDRPYRKSETSGDKPWKRNESTGDKPWKKDENSTDKPWKRSEGSSERNWKSKDQSTDKPWRKRDESEGGERRFERPSEEKRWKKPDDRGDRKSGFERRDKKPSKSGMLTDEPVRLNKYIANAGICSRREADTMIEAGAVTVNGIVVTELGTKVNPGDKVQIGNDTLNPQKKVYLLLNKPKGYITTVDDPQERNTVMMLVKDACRERIYPVGRLDRNTSGLLLMTNDGEIAKKLTHPSHRVRKIYQVELNKALSKADMIKMTEGIELEDGLMAIDEIAYTGAGDDKKSLGVVIHSGKNRIVRRMFEALEYEVVKLDRVAFANLTKKDLPRGRWRFLEESEINMLKMI